MMGSGGGPSIPSTADAANLATSASALSTLASLLEIVSDPAAAKSTLKELNSKSVEIQNLLDQVKNQYQAIETIHKDVHAKQVKIDSDLKVLDAQQNNLGAREKDLHQKFGSLQAREDSFLKAKQDFDQLKKQKETEHTNRAAVLSKAESDNAAKLSSMIADAEKTLAERKAALEAEFDGLKQEYTAKVDGVAKLQAEAVKAHETAKTVLTAAEDKKKLYEGRVASLKQLIQED